VVRTVGYDESRERRKAVINAIVSTAAMEAADITSASSVWIATSQTSRIAC
jgi:succinylarginine dihydrolase